MTEYTNNSSQNLHKSPSQNLSPSRILNQEILKIIQLTSQELVRLKGNDEFYEDINNAQKFIDIISGNCEISIRLIDHFVTKFSKFNKCSYKIEETNFNIHFDYKNQLKYYQKIHFDPFSRGDRIPFFMNDTCIITTIGQLNFFRWFISKNVFDFLVDKKIDVYNDMNKKQNVIKKTYNYTVKDKKLTEPIKKSIIMHNKMKESDKKVTTILVSF